MLGSNFIYKDKEVSVVLTSVFNYLLNNRFVNYGAGDEARVLLARHRRVSAVCFKWQKPQANRLRTWLARATREKAISRSIFG